MTRTMHSTLTFYIILASQPLRESAYAFDCTLRLKRLLLVQLICLTVKALRRITMCGFLVCATEPEKRTLKCVQLRIPD
jgi:hypothetical protein